MSDIVGFNMFTEHSLLTFIIFYDLRTALPKIYETDTEMICSLLQLIMHIHVICQRATQGHFWCWNSSIYSPGKDN